MLKSYLDRVQSDEVFAMQYFSALRIIVAILISILLVKSGLSLGEIALYELLFFVANFSSFFWSIAFKNSFLVHYHEQDESSKESYYYNVFLIYFAYSILAAIIYFFAVYFFQNSIYKSGINTKYIIALCCFLIFNTPAVLIEHIHLLEKSAKRILNYANAIFVIQLALLFTAILMSSGIGLVILVMVLWALLKFIYLLFLLYKKSKFSLNNSLIRTFITVSIPLIFNILLGGGMEYVDGFIVTSFMDAESFPLYRYGARELPLVAVLVTATTSALLPLASKNYDEAINKTKEKLTTIMHWIFPIAIVFMLFSPILFEQFYSAEFRISAWVFNIYLLTLITRFITPQLYLLANKMNKELLICSIIELVINLSLSLILMHFYGLVGIAFATFIAFVVHKACMYYFMRKKSNSKLSDLVNLRWYGLYSCLLTLSFLIAQFIHS